MNYGSVCSGIEAASVAWGHYGWKPVFFSEIEKFPSSVLAHHYGSNMPGEVYAKNGVPNYGDMTNFKEWPDHDQSSNRPIDVLVGGTPCQSYSVAGLRKGLDDPRGNLMLTFGAIAKRYQPKWIVWENVPGVLSSNGGRDFGTFLRLLGECGYGFAYRILDAQYVRVDGYGRAVAQRRRRVFVVGYLGDSRPAGSVLFEPESMLGDNKPSRTKREETAPHASSGFTASSFGQYKQGVGTLKASGGDLGGGSETLVTARMRGFGDYVEDETASAIKARDYKDATDLVAFNSRQETVCTHDVAGTLDGGSPQSQSIAYGIPGNWVGRKPENGGNAVQPMDNLSPSLTATDRHAVVFDPNQITSKTNRSNPKGDVCHTLPASSMPPHITQPPMAYEVHNQDSRVKELDGVCTTVTAKWGTGGGNTPIALGGDWRVRRLTPIECERLMGFPDNYSRIPWNGKPEHECPDGHRYKALGNSMAVNCMRWIAHRIEMVSLLQKSLNEVNPDDQ